ncbi:MAG TPA: hypothetical protein VIU86_13000 [Gaiellaceae bacterium]
MSQTGGDDPLEPLGVLVGEWSMAASFVPDPATAPRARTTFEWLPGERFLIQRWEVEHPDAPDGIAIIGADPETDGYLQHYFDSRGVARVYEMGFADGAWTLRRLHPGFSQRFTGIFSEDGDTISSRWERSSDGASWEDDFELTYTRVR